MKKSKKSINDPLIQVAGIQKLNNKYEPLRGDYTPNIALPKSKTNLNNTLNQSTNTQRLNDKYKNNEDVSDRPNRILPSQDNLLRNYKSSKRMENPISPKKLIKKSLMKRFLPYLIAGGSTGIGIGLGFKSLIL